MGKATALTIVDEPQVVGVSLFDGLAFDQWMEIGRDLFSRRRNIDWAIGDWGRYGRQHYRDDPQYKLMLEAMGVEPKRIETAAKVAEAFPPHLRATGVSFEVHEKLVAVSPDDRLDYVRRADQEHWTPRKAHHAVVEYRHAQGQLLDEDDDTTRLAVEIIRAWNRANPDARRYFIELAIAADAHPIDEDQVYD